MGVIHRDGVDGVRFRLRGGHASDDAVRGNQKRRAAIGPDVARTRELLVRQRTALINSLSGQLAEFGLIAPQGVWRIPQLHALAQSATSSVLPDAVRACVELIMGQIDELHVIGAAGQGASHVAVRSSA